MGTESAGSSSCVRISASNEYSRRTGLYRGAETKILSKASILCYFIEAPRKRYFWHNRFDLKDNHRCITQVNWSMSARQHVLQEISSSVYPLDVLDTKALVQIQCRPPWKAILKVSLRMRLLWHHPLRCNEYTSILFLFDYCYNFRTYHCPN